MSLELRNVTKRVGAEAHIHETTLQLEPGTFNILLGTTLAGKTTLMQLMAGLQQPTTGEVSFGGNNVNGVPVQKRNVSMVYQQFINYPNFTVYENIASPLRVAGVADREIQERVQKVAELLRLTPMLKRRPNELSGGQQQRTAIARALVKDSDLILLDEPLANLDARLREEMRFFIRSLQQRLGITTLYVTHDQSESMIMSNRVVVMFGGCIHQIGSAEDIYHRPATREVATFIGQTNLIPGRVVEARDGMATIDTGLGRFRCGTRRAVDVGSAVTAVVRPEALRLANGSDRGDFSGRVVARHFLGNLVDYRIALADGTVISIHALSGGAAPTGDAVSVQVDSDKAWLLP